MSPASADASGSSHKAVAASGGAGEEIAPLHQLFGQVSVRIDSVSYSHYLLSSQLYANQFKDTRATLVSLGGLDTRDFASQTLDDDDNAVFGPSKELFSVAINPQTGRPTNQYRLIPHPRNKIMYTGEDHFGNAHRHYHFYEVSVSREEMMFIRAGYGLPELVNMYIESALEGARARVMLTVPEREALNYMRSITGSGDKVEDFTYDQNGNKVGPSTEERETVSRAFETKLEQSLKDAARRLGVERQGLDGRTLLGLHLRKLADHIHDETHFVSNRSSGRGPVYIACFSLSKHNILMYHSGD